MKKKIKVTTPDGKTEEGTIEERNIVHFEIQKKYRAQVQESKKKYKRSRDKKIKDSDYD